MARHKAETLLHVLELLPPNRVRLQARTPMHWGWGRPLTSSEIAAKAGLSTWLVNQISRKTSWHSVRVEDMLRFCAACGVELLQRRRVKDYDRRNRFGHLANAAPSVRKYYEALKRGEPKWRNYGSNNSHVDRLPASIAG